MTGQARTRVGIIGAGNIAAIAQLPTLVKRDDVELAALVSRRLDPGPLMRRWGFGAAYGTVEDMLTAENLDAVFVLTPRSEHAHAVDACLRRDVDVFCEKPLAPSADEAERLADLADEHGRILMVDFNRSVEYWIDKVRVSHTHTRRTHAQQVHCDLPSWLTSCHNRLGKAMS